MQQKTLWGREQSPENTLSVKQQLSDRARKLLLQFVRQVWSLYLSSVETCLDMGDTTAGRNEISAAWSYWSNVCHWHFSVIKIACQNIMIHQEESIWSVPHCMKRTAASALTAGLSLKPHLQINKLRKAYLRCTVMLLPTYRRHTWPTMWVPSLTSTYRISPNWWVRRLYSTCTVF